MKTGPYKTFPYAQHRDQMPGSFKLKLKACRSLWKKRVSLCSKPCKDQGKATVLWLGEGTSVQRLSHYLLILIFICTGVSLSVCIYAAYVPDVHKGPWS